MKQKTLCGQGSKVLRANLRRVESMVYVGLEQISLLSAILGGQEVVVGLRKLLLMIELLCHHGVDLSARSLL